MVRNIPSPRIIPKAGTPQKRIERYVGYIVSGTPENSIAWMVSPSGWSGPFQIPESYEGIESIFVCDDAWHQGIGTTFKVYALTWIKEKNGRDIKMHVTVGNEDVIPIYQKSGLHPRQYILSNPGEL